MLKRLKKFAQTTLLALKLSLTQPDLVDVEDTPLRIKQAPIQVSANIEDLMDLAVLLDLREEGAINCTFYDLSVWTDVEEEAIKALVMRTDSDDQPLWKSVLKAMDLSHKDRHALRTALLLFISMSPQASIADTIGELAYQISKKRMDAEPETEMDQKVREAVMARYHIHRLFIMDTTEN
jgi:hypothetical protein